MIIPLELNSSEPLYEQIYRYLKEEIKTGRLAVNTKLPSTRNLAFHLQVSRNTIDLAYSQLVSEGYVESVPKSGYYVNEIGTLLQLSLKQKAIDSLQKNQTVETVEQNTLALEKDVIPLEHKQISSSQGIIQKEEQSIKLKYDFSPFVVDSSKFPFSTWRKLSNKCMNDMNQGLFLLGDNQGDLPLRQEIAKYLYESRGVNCKEHQIIIGAGADYLLQLLRKLLPKQCIVAMENPAYLRAYQILKGNGCKIVPVSVDKDGIYAEVLFQINADVVYVTPSHQYPLGVIMPIKRRRELLAWAKERLGRYIIEDDHDSEFRYRGKPIPSLQGIDTQETVIYLGTFSRAIAPGIRVGYMVLPETLYKKYRKECYYYASTVSRIDQAILYEFIHGGYFERHVNKMRKLYKCKHDTMLRALKIFGENIKITGEYAGLYLVVEFCFGLSEKELILLAQSNNIQLYGIEKYYLTKTSKEKDRQKNSAVILLGFANLTETQIEQGILNLYQAIKDKRNGKEK